MDGVTPEEFSQRYPRLYHMAEAGSWPSIREHGLRSTASLLDLYRIGGRERSRLLQNRRPEKVTLESGHFGKAVLRDQKPLTDAGLRRALTGSLTPSKWYSLINGLVFLWPTKRRLETFRTAQAYRGERKLILTLETDPFLGAYADKILLSAINSGTTRPFAHSRGPNTFLPIAKFPFKERLLRRLEPVAEVAVPVSIPDIELFVSEVAEVDGDSPRVNLLSP